MTVLFLTTHISFSVCNYFAPRQDKKVCKLSIVSIAHSAGGIEGKVGVVVGAGLVTSLGLGLSVSGLYMDRLSTSCGGAIIIEAVNSEITATVINVIILCLLFPISYQRKRLIISEFRQLTP